MNQLHPLATHAIRAAKNRKARGRYASIRYALNKGVPLGLYRLACMLENTKGV
jgi:hypothetical protein